MAAGAAGSLAVHGEALPARSFSWEGALGNEPATPSHSAGFGDFLVSDRQLILSM